MFQKLNELHFTSSTQLFHCHKLLDVFAQLCPINDRLLALSNLNPVGFDFLQLLFSEFSWIYAHLGDIRGCLLWNTEAIIE